MPCAVPTPEPDTWYTCRVRRVDANHVRNRQQVENAGQRLKHDRRDQVLIVRCQRRREAYVHESPWRTSRASSRLRNTCTRRNSPRSGPHAAVVAIVARFVFPRED